MRANLRWALLCFGKFFENLVAATLIGLRRAVEIHAGPQFRTFGVVSIAVTSRKA